MHGKMISRRPGATAPIEGTQEALDALLTTYSFDELLQSGDVLDVKTAAKRLGYKSVYGLQWACNNGKVAHFRQGRRYFFLKSQILSSFVVVPARP